jgi:hypothetical protein
MLMSLFGGHGKQLYCHAIVPGNSAPIGIHPSKSELGIRKSKAGSTTIQICRLGQIPRHAFGVFVLYRQSD